jgi:predicted 2-oxoglutarate/Fe(II)-dependent dioxygenase YbiX
MSFKPEQITECGGVEFYVVAKEPGHTASDLPTWASMTSKSIRFEPSPETPVVHHVLNEVPGAFQLLNVLNNQECDRFVEISEALGYHSDAPVSLPRSVRHNNNFTWVVDESIDGAIWGRCQKMFEVSALDVQRPLGLNARFRFYRYSVGDYFKPHSDGAWPGSRVVDGHLAADAYGDRFSQMSFLIFLSGDYEGGRTLFHTSPTTVVAVRTPKGAALVFPHGMHPQHCIHASEEITNGQKYIIRTDVLFGC